MMDSSSEYNSELNLRSYGVCHRKTLARSYMGFGM